jgi:MFS family permease
MSHSTLLGAGLVVLIVADLVLARAQGLTMVAIGVGLWGVHMGMTQGLLAAMVADTAPEDLRGTAYGFFNLLSGIAMLASSAIAGLLWDAFGSAFTFYVGAGFAALTLLGIALLTLRRRRPPSPTAA